MTDYCRRRKASILVPLACMAAYGPSPVFSLNLKKKVGVAAAAATTGETSGGKTIY